MVEINASYDGKLRCSAQQDPFRSTIESDAPIDNHGSGERFSPTDLLAGTLGTWMMTIMGIFAERNELDLTGTTVRVLKEMTLEPPRRIGKLTVDTPLHPQASGGVVAEAMKMQMPAVNNAFDTRPCGIMEIASN